VTFLRFSPAKWRQKSTGIDVEQNYVIVTVYVAFSALTLLVGQQEGHPACKN